MVMIRKCKHYLTVFKNFFHGRGTFYCFVIFLLSVTIFISLGYLGYPFPENENETKISKPVIFIQSGTVPEDSAWKDVWEIIEKIDWGGDIIVEISKYAPDRMKEISKLIKSGLIPAGDTFFMRYPFTLSVMDKRSIRGFQVSYISNGDDKTMELRRLSAHENSIIKYRALIEIARFCLSRRQKGDIEEAQLALKTAESIQTPKEWKSDVYYLLGHCYTYTGHPKKARNAFEEAIKLDPFFLNARWAFVRHLLNFTGEHIRSLSSQALLDIGAKVLSNVQFIASLGRDRGVFQDIATDIEKNSYDSPLKYLSIGYCLFFAGDEEHALVWLKQVLLHADSLPKRCEDEMKKRAQGLIDLIKEG